jgi:hypothetical protein
MRKTLLFAFSTLATAALSFPAQAAWTNTQSFRTPNNLIGDPAEEAAARGNAPSGMNAPGASAVGGGTYAPSTTDTPRSVQGGNEARGTGLFSRGNGGRRAPDPLRNHGAEGGESGGLSSDSPGF